MLAENAGVEPQLLNFALVPRHDNGAASRSVMKTFLLAENLQVVDISAIPNRLQYPVHQGAHETYVGSRFCRINDISLRDVASSNPDPNPNH